MRTIHAIAALLLMTAGCRRHQQTETRPTTMSTTERNKAAARRWSDELWSGGNLAVANEIVSPDYVRHDAGDPFPARGPQDVQKIVTMLRGMLPDLKIEIESLVAEGDFVVSRYTATSTDTRGYMGKPATGKV